MNLPNRLTIFRIFLVLPLIICLSLATKYGLSGYASLSNGLILFLVSALIFTLAMFTDFLDGYLARKNKQITDFGKLFDPLADKIMTSVTLIFLVILNLVPIWVVCLFIIRDIVVDGSRNVAAKHNLQIAASFWGKIKTLFQTIGILLVFIISPLVLPKQNSNNHFDMSTEIYLINIPLFLAMVFSLISGYKYIKTIFPIVWKSR